jgi:hypothetical protein
VKVTGRPFEHLGFTEPGSPTPIERRTFLGQAGALAGLVALPPALAHLDAGHRIGTETVGLIRERTARFRRLDEHLGGADTYRLFATELAATVSLLHEGAYTQDTGRELLVVLTAGAAGRMGGDDGCPGPDWAAWADGDELQIMTGRCWSQLHSPLRAVPVPTPGTSPCT